MGDAHPVHGGHPRRGARRPLRRRAVRRVAYGAPARLRRRCPRAARLDAHRGHRRGNGGWPRALRPLLQRAGRRHRRRHRLSLGRCGLPRRGQRGQRRQGARVAGALARRALPRRLRGRPHRAGCDDRAPRPARDRDADRRDRLRAAPASLPRRRYASRRRSRMGGAHRLHGRGRRGDDAARRGRARAVAPVRRGGGGGVRPRRARRAAPRGGTVAPRQRYGRVGQPRRGGPRALRQPRLRLLRRGGRAARGGRGRGAAARRLQDAPTRGGAAPPQPPPRGRRAGRGGDQRRLLPYA